MTLPVDGVLPDPGVDGLLWEATVRAAMAGGTELSFLFRIPPATTSTTWGEVLTDLLVEATGDTTSFAALAAAAQAAAADAEAAADAITAASPRGTGSPEGVVTASVGTRYTDTAATNGAVEWIKASGSGNTGWKVAYGDTGRRNVASLLENGATSLDGVRLSRAGNMVELWLSVTSPSWTSGHRLMQIPSGFRPPETLYLPPPYATLTPAILLDYGDLHVYKGTPLEDRWLLHWRTEDAWPTSLPGSAA